jgi:hypothetical protein
MDHYLLPIMHWGGGGIDFKATKRIQAFSTHKSKVTSSMVPVTHKTDKLMGILTAWVITHLNYGILVHYTVWNNSTED